VRTRTKEWCVWSRSLLGLCQSSTSICRYQQYHRPKHRDQQAETLAKLKPYRSISFIIISCPPPLRFVSWGHEPRSGVFGQGLFRNFAKVLHPFADTSGITDQNTEISKLKLWQSWNLIGLFLLSLFHALFHYALFREGTNQGVAFSGTLPKFYIHLQIPAVSQTKTPRSASWNFGKVETIQVYFFYYYFIPSSTMLCFVRTRTKEWCVWSRSLLGLCQSSTSICKYQWHHRPKHRDQ